MTLNQSVRVLPGVRDVDYDLPLAGFTGRIVAINEDDETLDVAWDGPTLRSLPDPTICLFLDEGMELDVYTLDANEVIMVPPRDTPAETEAVLRELYERYFDYEMYGGDSYPFALYPRLEDAPRRPVTENGWLEHIQERVVLPVLGRYVNGGELPLNTPLEIREWIGLKDERGLIVNVTVDRVSHRHLRLADLAFEPRDENTRPLEEYRIWYALATSAPDNP